MDFVATAVNALVVAAVGLLIGWLGKGRFDALEERINRFQGQVDARFARLEGQVDALLGSHGRSTGRRGPAEGRKLLSPRPPSA